MKNENNGLASTMKKIVIGQKNYNRLRMENPELFNSIMAENNSFLVDAQISMHDELEAIVEELKQKNIREWEIQMADGSSWKYVAKA